MERRPGADPRPHAVAARQRDLDELVDALQQEYQAELLAEEA